MYQIGWVFNSEKHRQDIETIISLTKDQGTLDELGLGSIRDGFANIFFPGTTTIQTRAKYFLIVPWILEDLYKRNVSFGNLRQLLRTEEAKAIEILKLKEDKEGLIGKEAGSTLKRMPSSIYWTGLKAYGIVLPDIAISQIPMFFTKRMKAEGSQTSRRLTKDDKLADMHENLKAHYFTSEALPKYPGLKNLTLKLNTYEASFIRKQILLKVPDSLLSFLLKDIETRKDFFKLDSFEKMMISLGKNCPYAAALENALLFDKIMKGAYIRYNYKLSEYADNETKETWENYWKNYLSSLSSFSFSASSFDLYFRKFSISNNTVDFCKQWILLVSAGVPSEPGIDKLLRTREISLKGTDRSRMNNPSLAQKTAIPIGIRIENRTGEIYYLNYRFNIARRMLQDIYYGLTQSEK